MSELYAIALGIVQGLTEFLPVSSSGHLAIFNLVFPNQGGSMDFTFLLHVATLLATLIYFRKDIWDMLKSLLPKNKDMVKERKMLFYLLIATVITGPIGLLLEPRLDAFSSNLLVLGVAYLITTVVLAAAEYFSEKSARVEPFEMGPVRAALVGLAQGIAVIPGISRSGSTIAGGMAIGLNRAEATRFSFLLVIPIILAGALKDGFDLVQGYLVLPGFIPSALGFLAAFIAGYFAIAVMVELVKRIKLYWFAAYTAILGVVLLSLNFFNIYG